MAGNEKTLPEDPFGSTHWSVILAAGDAESAVSKEALEQLCQSYWHPVYFYVRKRSKTEEDARDLTQAFFADLLDQRTIERANPDRGRFRAFLLTSLRNFLINQRKRARTQRRGGELRHLSLDFADAESRCSLEPANMTTPEQAFERQWVLTLLDRVLDNLKREYSEAGNLDLFNALKLLLTEQSKNITHAEVSTKLGITETASRAALSRLRKRYRILVKTEISETVASPEEVEDELKSLFRALNA